MEELLKAFGLFVMVTNVCLYLLLNYDDKPIVSWPLIITIDQASIVLSAPFTYDQQTGATARDPLLLVTTSPLYSIIRRSFTIFNALGLRTLV